MNEGEEKAKASASIPSAWASVGAADGETRNTVVSSGVEASAGESTASKRQRKREEKWKRIQESRPERRRLEKQRRKQRREQLKAQWLSNNNKSSSSGAEHPAAASGADSSASAAASNSGSAAAAAPQQPPLPFARRIKPGKMRKELLQKVNLPSALKVVIDCEFENLMVPKVRVFRFLRTARRSGACVLFPTSGDALTRAHTRTCTDTK